METRAAVAHQAGIAMILAEADTAQPIAFGEQKSLQSDRVVLEPGPVEEVETVRRMFAMFVHEDKHQREIAAILAQTDAPSPGSSQPRQ